LVLCDLRIGVEICQAFLSDPQKMPQESLTLGHQNASACGAMADDADGPKRQSTKTLPRPPATTPPLSNQLSHEKLPQTAIKEGWRKAKTSKWNIFLEARVRARKTHYAMRKIGFRAVSRTTCAGFWPHYCHKKRGRKKPRATTKNDHRSRARVVKMVFLAQHPISHQPKVSPARPDSKSLGPGITHIVHLPSVTISLRPDLAANPFPTSFDWFHARWKTSTSY